MADDKTLTRRQILKQGLYGSLAAGISTNLFLTGCGKALSGKTKPNVLLIVLDTARADHFSFMGYQRNTSPNIDKLASEGVIFEKAYSTNFWTLPSHASLFTALYPSQAGATSETNQLPQSNTTLAEVMKKSGYNTAAFSCNTWVGKERGFAKGFDEFYEMWRPDNNSVVPPQQGQPEWATLKKVLPWLQKQKENKNPFFTFINLNCAHMPYQPPETFRSKFLRFGYSNQQIERAAKIAGMWEHLAGKLELSDEDFRIMTDLYDGEIAFADHCVGQITNQLKTLGTLDDTIVIITSDHGENLGDHGLIDHLLSMYETTLHIPLVIRYPESFKPSKTTDLVSMVDIAPTILDLCNITDGLNQTDSTTVSLVDSDKPKRKFIIAENERPLNGIALLKSAFPDFDTSTINYRMRAIRTDHHKFIWNVGDGRQLYDLNTDPNELLNIADKQTQTRDKLQAMLKNWMAQIPSASDISFLQGQDTESLEILRSLGYIK